MLVFFPVKGRGRSAAGCLFNTACCNGLYGHAARGKHFMGIEPDAGSGQKGRTFLRAFCDFFCADLQV